MKKPWNPLHNSTTSNSQKKKVFHLGRKREREENLGQKSNKQRCNPNAAQKKEAIFDYRFFTFMRLDDESDPIPKERIKTEEGRSEIHLSIDFEVDMDEKVWDQICYQELKQRHRVDGI